MTAPADLEPGFSLRRFLLSGDGWPYLLVPFIPAAIVLELVHAGATPIFLAAALGVIPTAALMGRSTEELAARSGPGVGGFLNVTFGNAPELIIALFALAEGLQEVVKASIVGSILGNILLVMGAAMLAGGLRRDRQYFDRTAAGVQSLMLLLAAVALVMPAIFELVAGEVERPVGGPGQPGPGHQLEDGRHDQGHGGQQEHPRLDVGGGAVEVLALAPQPSDQHGRPHDEQDVAEDGADDGGLDDFLEALAEGEQGDDELGGVAEGDVEEPADPRAGAGGQLLGRSSHQRRRRDDPQRGSQEHPRRSRVQQFQRDRYGD